MKIKNLTFYIGYDSKEDIAYRVCKNSLINTTSISLKIQSLKLYELISKKLYTRNIDLTIHHCKKAYLYYIEFISQIGEDNNSFLQLNSKDATLFVYKKTIFDLNNSVRKTFHQVKNEKNCLTIVINIIDIYNKLILMSLYSMENEELKNNKSMIIMIEKESTKIMNKIFLNNLYTNTMFCEKIKEFLYLIDMKNIEIYKKKINIIYIFVKKLIVNKKINMSSIKQKMCDRSCEEKLDSLTALKFVNWLLNFN